jgi:hypothetical protein
VVEIIVEEIIVEERIIVKSFAHYKNALKCSNKNSFKNASLFDSFVGNTINDFI